MALPNLNSPTKVEGKTVTQAVGTSLTAILSNAANSNKSLRINLLYLTNVDGSSAADVNATIYDGTTDRYIASTVSVPADSSLLIVQDRPLYLMEGQSLRLSASASGDIEAVCSYEEIS